MNVFKTIQNIAPGSAPMSFAVIAGIFVLHAIFCFAVLQWKRWGFYGIVMTSAAVLPVTISTGWGVGMAVVSIVWMVGLLVLLNRGGDEQLWLQLE